MFENLITPDQHWAGTKLAETLTQAGGIKGCLANVDRTSGGGGKDDRRMSAVWQVAKAMRSIEKGEGKVASRLVLDVALDLIEIRGDRISLIRSSLDALGHHYGLGRWEPFSLLARSGLDR